MRGPASLPGAAAMPAATPSTGGRTRAAARGPACLPGTATSRAAALSTGGHARAPTSVPAALSTGASASIHARSPRVPNAYRLKTHITGKSVAALRAVGIGLALLPLRIHHDTACCPDVQYANAQQKRSSST